MHIYDQAQVGTKIKIKIKKWSGDTDTHKYTTPNPNPKQQPQPQPQHQQPQNFQGGWALVSEQLPYAVGAARSILLDRLLDPEGTKVLWIA
jgi:hypothetical protein